MPHPMWKGNENFPLTAPMIAFVSSTEAANGKD